MPQLLKTDIVNTTHRRDLAGYEHWDQHNFANAALIGIHLDIKNMFGAIGDGITDDAAALQEAVDAAEAAGGGIVFIPPGRYLIGDTIEVPSRVVIRGAGMHTTRLFAPASYANQYMFETVQTADVNEFGQTYGIGFEEFTIEDRASTNTEQTPTGRSEEHHGFLIHDADWGWFSNVNIADLQGIAVNLDNVVREWFFYNMYMFNCADGDAGLAALEIGSDSGDATNTLYFFASRCIFSQGTGINIGGTQAGIRLINFTDCQFEGGGSGTGPTYGDPAPYDIVTLNRLELVSFKGCNFSGPGTDKHCLNIIGSAAANIARVDVQECRFNGNGDGGCIKTRRCNTLSIAQAHFDGSTAATGDIYIESDSGAIFLDESIIYSNEPFAGPGDPETYIRGKLDATTLSFAGWTSQLAGGMWKAQSQQGAAEFLASSAENTVFNYTIGAGQLGLAGGLTARLGGFFDFSGGATTVRVRVKVGGTTIWDATSASLTIGADTPWNMEFVFRNVGLTNVNSLQGSFRVGNATAVTAGIGAFGTLIAQAEFAAQTTIDMTSARQVLVTIQLGAARDNVVRTAFGRVE